MPQVVIRFEEPLPPTPAGSTARERSGPSPADGDEEGQGEGAAGTRGLGQLSARFSYRSVLHHHFTVYTPGIRCPYAGQRPDSHNGVRGRLNTRLAEK